ncbi:MAG: transcription-repair coupling factor, partial [Gammaproteobacteria bacterium]|nr:transcription-repair coupling factor [Gammaproteobacteria bacterium]
MEHYQSVFEPLLPRGHGRPMCWGRLYGAAAGTLLAQAGARHAGPLIAVVADMQSAYRLETEVRFFRLEHDLPVLVFPDWETLPYDIFSPHQDIVSQRLETLYRLPTVERGVLIVAASTLMQRLAPREHLDASSLMIDAGDRLELDVTRRRLEAAGYHYVAQVMEHGEFAVRGSLIDLYPMGAELPYRIDLFDEEVESIRTFDPESQRSVAHVEGVRLLPAHEFPLTAEAIGRFRRRFRARFEGDPRGVPVYRDVSQGLAPGGVEYYLPLFFEHTDTLFDYLPDGALVVTADGVEGAAEQFWSQVQERYEEHRHDRERPLVAPEELFLDPEALSERIASFRRARVQSFELEGDTTGADCAERVNYATSAPPDLQIRPRTAEPGRALNRFLEAHEGRALFAAESPGRREALLTMLREQDLHPAVYEDWQAFLRGDRRHGIVVAPIEHGVLLDDPPTAVIAEAQLFGERAMQRRRRARVERDAEALV